MNNMTDWEKFKQWVSDTVSFRFIKNLILENTNSNLKEAMAWFNMVAYLILAAYCIIDTVAPEFRYDVLFLLAVTSCTLLGIDVIGKWRGSKREGDKRKIENEGSDK